MKRIGILILLSVAVFLACGETGPGGKLFYKGKDFLSDGRPMDALRVFTELDSLKPDSIYGKFGIGLYFENERLNLDAQNEFDSILELSPGFVPCLIEAAWLALEMNDPVKAHKRSEKAYRVDKENADILTVYSESLRRMGSPDKAEALIKQGLSLFPDNPGLNMIRARLYLQTGKTDSALWVCSELMRNMNPESGHILEIGEIYSRLGMSDSAAYYYETAYGKRNDDFYLSADLADAFIEIGYMNRARQIINELKKKTTDSYRTYLAEKSIAELQGDFRRADLTMFDAYSIFPKRPTTLVDIAQVKFKLHQPEQAYRFYQLAIDRQTYKGFNALNTLHLRMDRAEKLFEEGHVASASSRITEILDNPPNDFKIIRICALFYTRMAEPAKARTLLNRMERMSRGLPWHEFGAAKTYLTLDSLDKAQAIYDKIRDIYKFEPDFILTQIKLYKAHNNNERCLLYIDSLPEYLWMYRPIAIDKFEILMSLEKFDDALVFAENFIEKGPFAVERYGLAFRAAEALGDSENMTSIVVQCLENNNGDPDALSFAAEHYYKQGDNARAMEMVNKITEIDSLFIPAHLIHARVLKDEGNIDSVKVIYNWIISKYEYAGEALSGLAWIEMDSDGDMNLAVNCANRAIRANSEEPYYMFTRAMAYHKSGLYANARTSYENLLKRVPNNPLYNFHAGVNYLDEEKVSEARKHLKEAIKLGLPDDLKKEAERLLTGI